jgi:hypothetical protein
MQQQAAALVPLQQQPLKALRVVLWEQTGLLVLAHPLNHTAAWTLQTKAQKLLPQVQMPQQQQQQQQQLQAAVVVAATAQAWQRRSSAAAAAAAGSPRCMQQAQAAAHARQATVAQLRQLLLVTGPAIHAHKLQAKATAPQQQRLQQQRQQLRQRRRRRQ